MIQAHLPVHLPCYDFVPVTSPTFDGALLAVKLPASGVTSSHDVTGGVYKARERIQRTIADARLLLQSELRSALRDWLHLAAWQPIVPTIVACV